MIGHEPTSSDVIIVGVPALEEARCCGGFSIGGKSHLATCQSLQVCATKVGEADMLQHGYLSVLEAKTLEELRQRIVSFGEGLGFERVGATAIVDNASGSPAFLSVDNTPEAYAALADDGGRAARDPVVQHCKHSGVPIMWSQDTYTTCGLGSQWEEQRPFGYGHGIALALHLPQGRHFLFGVNRAEPLPTLTQELTRLVADVQLFAVHAYEAAARLLFGNARNDIEVPALTPREIECLRWTMEGKTAWEVGSILGISERTAVLHVSNAAHKLNCASKHQAVIKAMRMGLIH
jgi:DNA-binding CsgD family transcriptional regulator